MKSKNLTLYALIGVVVTELMILFILYQMSVSESYAATSISKGTILMLLVVGVIGILGVGRKKIDSGSHAPNDEARQATGHDNLNEEKQKIIA